MLIKSAGGTLDDGAPMARVEHPLKTDKVKSLVTRSFLEALFASLHEDLKAVKKDLFSDLQKVHRDLDRVGEKVATLQDKDSGYSKEIEWL
ncbi:hypothetical protein NDU88_006535 [Pleurodeles waltl]|uniref:Rx N-terminal domain-containing protein n=1 Tax=Pleurodeles waltl TaxID=8319 RepID=A0AAV7NTD5_PLEWA|nr:hypothetical protein NDU88_006535 [Pleurodeles waltl]